MRRCWLLLLCGACGDDGATPDAHPDVTTARCDPSAPFEAPVPVDGLNSAVDDTGARLSPDELFVVFARRTSAQYDLYTAKRTSTDVPFETPALLATQNSINSDFWPTIAPSGLLLAFHSDRSTAMFRVYTSTRPTVDDPFGPPVISPALLPTEEHSYLANNRALYFSSTRTGGLGMHDIWRAEIDSTGATSAPVAVLGGVNTAENEVTPALTEDELRIFFRRTVGTENDIYTASRTAMTDGFGASTPVPGLSQPGINEIPTWVSPDGCALYLEIVAPAGGMGGDDLFVARRGPP